MAYIILFLYVGILSIPFQKSIKAGKKATNAWAFFLIIVPSIFAAVRSPSLGTDNPVYAYGFFRVAAVDNFYQVSEVSNYEPLYNFLCYTVSRFTSDYHFLCFWTELITMYFLVKGVIYLKKTDNTLSVPFALLVWMFCQYCNFINIVRQGISVAIILYAIRFVLEEKPAKYLFWVAIACMFHKLSFLALLLYFVYNYSKSNTGIIKTVCLACVLAFCIFIEWRTLLDLAVKAGFVSNAYAALSTRTITDFSIQHTLKQFIYRLPIIVIATIQYSATYKRVRYYKFWFLLLWFELIISQAAIFYQAAQRLSLYCWLANLVVLPAIAIPYKGESRIVAKSLILVYLCCYWLYFYVFNGYGFEIPVYPFVSDLF